MMILISDNMMTTIKMLIFVTLANMLKGIIHAAVSDSVVALFRFFSWLYRRAKSCWLPN